MFVKDGRRPRWASRRRLLAAALGLGVGLAVAVAGSVPAQALTGYAPLPTAPSSLLAALEGSGGFTTAEAAAGAAGGTVATAPVAGVAAGMTVAGIGAFIVTAGTVGVLTRATGGSTSYLCAAGSAVAALYGQNCSGFGTSTAITSPNNDTASLSKVCDSANKCISITGQIVINTVNGPIYYWSGTSTGIAYGTDGNVTSAYTSAFLACLGAPAGGTACPGGQTSLTPQQGKALNASWGTNLSTTAVYFPGAPGRGGYQAYCIGGSTRTAAQTTAFNNCINGTTGPATTNPQRFFKTTVFYTDGTSASAQSATFYETDATLPQWPKVSTPAGSNGIVQEIRVDEWLADLTGSQNIYDQTTTSAYQNAATAYPACINGSNCQLRIQVDHSDCVVGGSALCQNWFTSTNPVPTGHTIECYWGGYKLSLSECNVLSNYYIPSHQADGTQYTDPGTGAAPSGNPQTGPKVDTTTSNPSASPSPSASGSTGTSTGGGITTDPNSKDCLGAAVTSNPVTWVTGPVTCALQAAFEPSASNLAAKQADVATKWQATALAQTATAAVAVFPTTAPASTCSGFQIDLSPIFSKLSGAAAAGSHSISVGNACAEPIKTIAAICNLALIVTFGVGGVLAATRYIGAAVNYRGAGSTSANEED